MILKLEYTKNISEKESSMKSLLIFWYTWKNEKKKIIIIIIIIDLIGWVIDSKINQNLSINTLWKKRKKFH